MGSKHHLISGPLVVSNVTTENTYHTHDHRMMITPINSCVGDIMVHINVTLNEMGGKNQITSLFLYNTSPFYSEQCFRAEYTSRVSPESVLSYLLPLKQEPQTHKAHTHSCSLPFVIILSSGSVSLVC